LSRSRNSGAGGDLIIGGHLAHAATFAMIKSSVVRRLVETFDART